MLEQRDEERGLPEFGDDGEQPHLHRLAARRQKRVEIRQLAVERERPAVPEGEHADELAAVERNHVEVFMVKPIDEASFGVRSVLGYLLDEGAIIELVDLFELPRFRGDFDPEVGTRSFHGRENAGFAG